MEPPLCIGAVVGSESTMDDSLPTKSLKLSIESRRDIFCVNLHDLHDLHEILVVFLVLKHSPIRRG